MALAALHPQLLLKIIAPIEHIIDKVLARLHRHDIDTSVRKLVNTYSSSAKDMVHNISSIVIELVWAVVANICEIICFAFVGLAFGVNDFTAVICIYVVVTLAAMASPIPQGVGVVEAAALVAFTIFGIQQATDWPSSWSIASSASGFPSSWEPSSCARSRTRPRQRQRRDGPDATKGRS